MLLLAFTCSTVRKGHLDRAHNLPSHSVLATTPQTLYSKYTKDTLPRPNDASVQIKEVGVPCMRLLFV